MELNGNVLTTDERNTRVVSFLKLRLAEKRRAERRMVEDYRTNNVIQAALAELDRHNEERGTPIIHL